jgi:hypothetical protein
MLLFRSRTSKGWSTDVSVDAGKMSVSSKLITIPFVVRGVVIVIARVAAVLLSSQQVKDCRFIE